MREKEFRAWDKLNKEMIPWEWFIDWEPPIKTEVNFFDENLIFIQYTGLKDKNGVKIFEGDIIEGVHDGDEFISNVYWDDAGFCVAVTDQYFPWLGEIMPVHDDVMGCIEVIGNIHENPELMKGL